jgi:hypothetical protein
VALSLTLLPAAGLAGGCSDPGGSPPPVDLGPGSDGAGGPPDTSGPAADNATGGPDIGGGGDATAPPVDGAAAGCTAAGPTVVHFPTDDGLQLEADLYTTGQTGGPAAILIHMIPPSNDRTNFPPAFIADLTGNGLSVLNFDRRGAGGSQGNPMDAYLGPNGKLDAKGARDFLAAHPCGFDLHRLVIIAASNGTTTAVDYTVLTASDASLETPRALVFLTGGTYTEAQNTISDQRATFEPIPMLFVFSTEERAWSAGYEPGAPSGWMFKEYNPGAHGVGMFMVQPTSMQFVADFASGALQ